jgi:hypothetical protein
MRRIEGSSEEGYTLARRRAGESALRRRPHHRRRTSPVVNMDALVGAPDIAL